MPETPYGPYAFLPLTFDEGAEGFCEGKIGRIGEVTAFRSDTKMA